VSNYPQSLNLISEKHRTNKPMHAADLLSKRAELTPDRVALVEVETGCRYSYAELNARANRLANFLYQQLGVQPGDRVSILARNSVVYLDLLYGLPKIGAVFAPFNWRLTAHELTYMVADLTPTVIFCEPEFAVLAEKLRGQAPNLRVVMLRQAVTSAMLSYEAEIAAADVSEPARPRMNSETPYCILYTSGTTGHPKGAIIPHRQVLFNAINTVISWGLTEHDVSPIFTPLFHAGGLFAFLTPILYVGGRIVLARDFDAAATLRTITNERCTVILGVPTLFQMWLETAEFATADFSHVHFFINGGAICPPQLVQTWRQHKGVVFRQGYGLTEAGVNCFSSTDADAARKPGSVGKPIFHSEMRIVDPETGRDVADGAAGELLIRGPHITSGYWRKPEATAAALRGGWLYTGDIAHRDADGFYFIDGRYKDMIKSGGENIYAAEVEGAFRLHPAVKDAALIGRPDPTWGEVGVLLVVRAAGTPIDADALLAFGRERLARYKLPKTIIFTDALPYSPYGKVEKAKLRELYAS
jgi:fatty-acyl-CoA synthase